MVPEFLLPETTVRANGSGPVIHLNEERGGMFALTLGITRILEHEGVELSVMGSEDEIDFVPLASFTQKFYCGVYRLELDLTSQPHLKYLRVQWKVNRWNRVSSKAVCTLYVEAKTLDHRLLACGA